MKVLKIAIVMLILAMSVSAVCAADNIACDNHDFLNTAQEDISSAEDSINTFTDLKNNISYSTDSFEMKSSYTFNNATDSDCINGIVIDKTNFIIEGNGLTVDGNGQSRIFNITGTNITINNLVFKNGNAQMGGAIYAKGQITLNNVTFINNSAAQFGGAVLDAYGGLDCYGSYFIDNYAETGSALYLPETEMNMYDTYITSNIENKFAQIGGKDNAKFYLDNVTFENIRSMYAPALYLDGCLVTLVNSRFINLTANRTAGAIGIKNGGDTSIINCEFINTRSSKNAGAIYADITGMKGCDGNVTIEGTLFRDAHSGFGGAYMQLGGKLFINNSDFENNSATLNGGSVYISFTDANINNCTFDLNSAQYQEGYPTYGGAIYADYSEFNITDSRFINNSAPVGGAIYAADSIYAISRTTFADNINALYTDFDRGSYLDNATNVYNDDTRLINNTSYQTIIFSDGMELELLDNVIDVNALPTRFDLRDWYWVTPVKNQGDKGACWTFGMLSSLESALLKACGISTNLSENNMQNTMLKYSKYGYTYAHEFGGNTMAVSYLVGWLGAFSEDYDSYDELGKISPIIQSGDDFHVQDVMFVSMVENNGSYVKAAILQHGVVDGAFYGQATAGGAPNPYFNPKTSAQYVNESIPAVHEISIVGWDDNYSRFNFLEGCQPPGDGAWIIKNSMGKDWGDNGYVYVSYYDKTLSISTDIGEWITSILFENTVPYNKNYQREFCWDNNFIHDDNISYANQFVALDDDLVAAVGTYFEGAGVNYTVEIYVNDELKLTQDGVSPYFGYHTIKLDKYIPIKAGDIFYAVINSNAMPVCNINDTRVHSANGMSYMFADGQWHDLYDYGKVACLKIYTVADDTKIINNSDIIVDYAGGSYFSVNVVADGGHAIGAGEVVTFTINNVTYNVTTDENSTAKLEIIDAPGEYTIVTKYNGNVYQNNVTVNNVLTATKATIKKKTAKNLVLAAKLKINGKNVKGKWIKFKLNGKKYYAKTNKYGTAKIVLGKDVINSLNKGIYKVKVFFGNSMIKTKVKVK